MKALLAVLLLSSSSYAAENRLAVKLFGNQTLAEIKAQGSASNGKLGAGLGVEYLRRVSPRFSIGAEIDQLGRTVNATDTLVNNTQGTLEGSVTAFLAMARYDFRDSEKAVRPYVSAGAGLAIARLKATLIPIAPFAWSTGGNDRKTIIDSSGVGGAFSIRGGADVSLSDRWSLGAELGYVRTTEIEHDLTAEGRSLFKNASTKGAEQSLIFGVAAGYRF